jgi:hypothetical protein
MNSQWQKSLKFWYLLHPKSKTYEINFIKSCYRDLSNNIPMAHPNSSYLKWMVDLQMWPRSQLISPSKTWSFMINLNFQRQKSLKNQYLHHPKSKSYETYSIKSSSTRSLQQQHQRHIPIPLKFSIMIYFSIQSKNRSIIQELLHHQSKHYETKLMHPSLSEIFPKTSRTWSETPQFDESHGYKTIQNKLPSLIDRWVGSGIKGIINIIYWMW